MPGLEEISSFFIVESAAFLFTIVGTVLENKLFSLWFLPALSCVFIELFSALLGSTHAIACWLTGVNTAILVSFGTLSQQAHCYY